MKKLSVRLQASPERVLPVGTLAEQDRRIYFEYDSTFLDLGLQLSPSRTHCLSLAERAGIPRAKAAGIIEEVNFAISGWRDFAEQAGCPKRVVSEAGKRMRPL